MKKNFYFFVFFLCFSILGLSAGAVAGGSLIGVIYEANGTTPVAGASLMLQHCASGKMYQSEQSSKFGFVKIEGLEDGMYQIGVATSDGHFNLDSRLGLRIPANKIAKVSIAIDPYEKRVASAMQEIIESRKKDGELLVGTVLSYDAETGLAEVEIIRWFLEIDMKIHIEGDKTDFKMKLSFINAEGVSAKKAFPGEKVFIEVKKPVMAGDLIYIICDKAIFPFLLLMKGNVAGIAMITAVTSFITYHVVKIIVEEPEASPFK